MIKKKRKKSKKVVVITGSPGTGKSTLAVFLSKKLGLGRFDISKYYDEISTGYDNEKQCYDVDVSSFTKLVKKRLEEALAGIIVDSHISHHLPKNMVDVCVVVVCSNLKKLKKRLEERKYGIKKVRENLDAEIFQVCLVEAQEKGHEIIVVDSSGRIDKKGLVQKVKEMIG